MAPGLTKRWAAVALVALASLLFLGLGIWQIERRAWKLDLIARVEARLGAEPAAAPGPDVWPTIERQRDEYRRILLRGTFDHGREALVQAVTELGPGFWVMTPLRSDRGFTVLVNRGFVPTDRRAAADRRTGQIEGSTAVAGLLRLSEPGGGFLRSNDPDADRWYSRDVAAIAAAGGLDRIAPYFVDADATPNPGGFPVGGLTVVAFRNTHLVYALTWFALAAMAASFAGWLILRPRG
ncbi:SURF1 family protein [Enterovirga rhinocerotis]|uniref:SURF1-like protein n=1 Tax=Enterovirga rhinocerotis TaxID=1339210 RepID=A0A4R7BVT1_9HYPH|nr:SURF1 family protein [Enterovirga rhinocerotis]TDR89651.1 surfeit locus 1 family protein [Enterovirga rhinocerotis]